MNAKEYLKRIKKLDSMIRNKTFELEQWYAMATSVTVPTDGERVQSSGNQHKMESAIVNHIDIKEKIDRSIVEMMETKAEIIEVIEQLPVDEYNILHLKYVQFKELDEVADICGKSYSWATTIHGRALKDVQNILDSK